MIARLCALGLAALAAVPLAASPVFKLAVSEYPSWSLFLTAHDQGLIHLEEGKQGPLEKKWDVDLVLIETDYDSCITLYGSGQVDAACLTNMDALAPSLQIPSVAILPTSTSAGADQCIVSSKYEKLADLKGQPVYGLENSVSQYLFERYLEQQGENPRNYKFSMMDPAAASTAFLQGKLDAVVVWNPFCMEIHAQNPEAKLLFSSKAIPGEIVDMVIASEKSLQRDGGDRFAACVADTYYRFCGLMNQPKTRDAALTALGKRFSKLGLEDMKQIVVETAFYSQPQNAIALYQGTELPATMEKVSAFCVKQGIVAEAPKVVFGASVPGANLTITTRYIEMATAKKK